MQNVIILGYGSLGQRLTPLLQDQYSVIGVCRSDKPANGAKLILGDCRNQDLLFEVASEHCKAIIVIMTPDEYTDLGYKKAYVDAVEALLPAINNTDIRVIFVSSTSVYGQNDGQSVDERSATEPERFNGKRVLEAETLLLNAHNHSTVIRFGGIYGRADNRKLSRIRAGHFTDQPGLWTNRVHVDDCVGIIQHLLSLDKPQSVYIGCDNTPVLSSELETWLSQELGTARPMWPEPIVISGKRCLNNRLRASGYSMHYPSFKEGYRALLTQ